MKHATLAGYMAADLTMANKALLTAWDCLPRFHEDMVLIGGLAIVHLTKSPSEGLPGPVTLDVDFGISIGTSGGIYDSIRTTLSGHGFQWVGGRFLRKFADFEMHIDLLTDDGSGAKGTVVVDEGLQVSLTPGVNRALTCNRTMAIEGPNLVGAIRSHRVRIAEIGPMLVLKLNAFASRRAPKDAHDILYLGMNYLDGTEKALESFRAEKSAGNPGLPISLECLRKEFAAVDSNGPLSCAAFRLNDLHLTPAFREESRRIQEQCVTLAQELLRD